MYQQVVARRYAKGLMLAARDQDLDLLASDISAISDALLRNDPNVRRLFEDPSFSPIEQKAVIRKIAQQSQMNPVLEHFLLLLVDKDRVLLLPLICDSLRALVDDYRGRLRANIKSATPLSPQMVEEIGQALKKISKKEVLAVTSVEPDLIGGIRVEMGGMVFDGSVKARLSAIKNKLVNNASM